MINRIPNQFIIDLAGKYNFDLAGFSKAELLEDEVERLIKWNSRNYNASMQYMSRNYDKKKDVKIILPSAESVISLGINYYKEIEYSEDASKGKISRYALTEDYHLILNEKLNSMVAEIKTEYPFFEAVHYTDAGPVMDKMWAKKSGLGWQGKNSNIINKEKGSWFFISNIICNVIFDYNETVADHCGTCSKCIDACPTNAIVDNYIIDSNKCISFLTIENKEEYIDNNLIGKFNNWLFGCDICQEVCPWNEKFQITAKDEKFLNLITEPEIDLNKINNMTEEEFRIKFKYSPVKRSKLKGLKRNAEFLNKQKDLNK